MPREVIVATSPTEESHAGGSRAGDLDGLRVCEAGRKRDTESEYDREPDQPHGYLGVDDCRAVYANGATLTSMALQPITSISPDPRSW